MSRANEQGEPGDPEPLEALATLLMAGVAVAVVCAFGDWLRFLGAFRRWM